MTQFLSSPEQLKDIFGIDDLASFYSNYSPLSDRTVGFSVERDYPKNIRFKPPYYRDGSPDIVAIIHVVYAHPADFGDPIKGEKVPIYLAIFTFSKYMSNHRDYDFDDPNSPNRESVLSSDSTPRPIDLRSMDDYYYDHKTNLLHNKRGKIVLGEFILNDLFSDHCKTVKRLFRLRIGVKSAIRNVHTYIYGKLITTIKYLMDKLFGRKLTPEDAFSGILQPYKKEDIKMEKGAVINILGYEASKKVILTFCFLYIFVSSILYFFRIKSGYMAHLVSNNLAIICTAITTIWILDTAVPWLLFILINHFLKRRKSLLFKGIKI
jgi:hypothetical protein